MVELLATLNRLPIEIITQNEQLRTKVHGCTDITGFGLAGHLHELAEASGVSIHVAMDTLPVLPQALDYAGMGIIPEGAYRNKSYYSPWVRSALPELDSLEMLAYDPQTSGGLLLAMERDAAEQLLQQLRQVGYAPKNCIIGEVGVGNPGLVFLHT